MAQVVVLTDDGREVARYGVSDASSPQALGRALIGRQDAPLGWLGRALRDARVMQAGGDRERLSEKAMRLSQRARR